MFDRILHDLAFHNELSKFSHCCRVHSRVGAHYAGLPLSVVNKCPNELHYYVQLDIRTAFASPADDGKFTSSAY